MKSIYSMSYTELKSMRLRLLALPHLSGVDLLGITGQNLLGKALMEVRTKLSE